MSEVPQPRPDGPVDAPHVEATDAGTAAVDATDPRTTTGEDVSGRVDLDEIERDLDAVETALGRLDDGTYWRDESTGEEIPDSTLDDDPTARRA